MQSGVPVITIPQMQSQAPQQLILANPTPQPIATQTFVNSSRKRINNRANRNNNRNNNMRKPNSTRSIVGRLANRAKALMPSRTVAIKGVTNSSTSTDPVAAITSIDFASATADITRILKTSMANPSVVMIALTVVAIVVSSGPTFNNGPVATYIRAQNGTNAFFTWVTSSPSKFYGMLVFAPAVLTVPSQYRLISALVSLVWIYLVPEYTIYEYFIQAGALFCFFRTTQTNTRSVLAIFTFIAYYVGYLVLSPTPVEGGLLCQCYDAFGRCVTNALTCASMSACYTSDGLSIPCPIPDGYCVSKATGLAVPC